MIATKSRVKRGQREVGIPRDAELMRVLREIAGLAVQSPGSRFVYPALQAIERKAREAIKDRAHG